MWNFINISRLWIFIVYGHFSIFNLCSNKCDLLFYCRVGTERNGVLQRRSIFNRYIRAVQKIYKLVDNWILGWLLLLIKAPNWLVRGTYELKVKSILLAARGPFDIKPRCTSLIKESSSDLLLYRRLYYYYDIYI